MSESKFAERAAATKNMLGAAAQLAKKQAELTKLETVVLPKIYFAIGKALSEREDLPEELGAVVARIKEVRVAMEKSREADAGKPVPDGVWAHATRYAEKASQAASGASTSVHVAAICTQLGKLACENYGNRFVPAERALELREVQGRRDKLLSEVAVLESEKGLGFLSVRQIAITGVVFACFLSACVALTLFGYPLIAVYALARLCVLIATSVCLLLACMSVWHYVRGFLFGQGDGLRHTTPAAVRKAIARAIALVLLLYLMPIPRVAVVGQQVEGPVRMANTAGGTVSESANVRQGAAAPASSSGNKELARRSSNGGSDESASRVAERKMGADMFMGILMQAAAMDQMARQAAPRIPQQYYTPPSYYPPPASASPRFGTPHGGGYGGANSAPRFTQEEGICGSCGFRTGRQTFPVPAMPGIPKRRTCHCGGLIVWAQVE